MMYVPRRLEGILDKLRGVYPIIAVVGARQAGKTTLLRNRMPEDASYVLFNDIDARDMFDSDIKQFELQYIKYDGVTVLDEVQYCSRPGDRLKYLADVGHRLWITSSSQAILSENVLSFLVGRVTILRLYPFDLYEFVDAKGYKALTEKMAGRALWEHIRFGGYPRVVLTRDTDIKSRILSDLIETMLLKDVAYTFSIHDLGALQRLTAYLASKPGLILNFTSAASDLGISFHTLKGYLNALERSYVIHVSPPFFTNKMKEIIKQPRIYFVDTGLRNAVSGSLENDIDGPVFENYIVSELVKLGHTPKHWRTKSGSEVDVVLDLPGGPVPIEVKLSSQRNMVTAGMRSFIREYDPKKAYIVSLRTTAGVAKVGRCSVQFCDPFTLLKEFKNTY